MAPRYPHLLMFTSVWSPPALNRADPCNQLLLKKRWYVTSKARSLLWASCVPQKVYIEVLTLPHTCEGDPIWE